MESNPPRALIVDDHYLVSMGLKMVLEKAGFEVVACATSGSEAVEKAQETVPDVILMDLIMPGMDGFEALSVIKETVPHSKILVTTAFTKGEYLIEALAKGASGYITKDDNAESIIDAVNAVLVGTAVVSNRVPLSGALSASDSGESHQIDYGRFAPTLTSQELKVLKLIARGLDNEAIADELALSINTIKSHVSRILTKLDLPDRTNVAIWAHRNSISG